MLFRIANDPVPSRSEPIPSDLVLLHPIAMYEELFRYAQLAQEEGYKIPREFGDLRKIGAFKNWWYGQKAWKLFAVRDDAPIRIRSSSTQGISVEILKPENKTEVLAAINEFLETGELAAKDTSKFSLNLVKDYTFDERDRRKFFAPLSNLTGERLRKKVDELGPSEGIVGFLSTWGRLATFRAAYTRLLEYEGDDLKHVKAAYSLGYFSDISNIDADDFIKYASLERAYNETKSKRTLVVSRGIEKVTRNNDPFFNTIDKQKKLAKVPSKSDLNKKVKKDAQETTEADFKKLEDEWRAIAVGEHLFQTENGKTAKVVLNNSVGLNKLDFIRWKIDTASENLNDQKNKCIETFIGIGSTPFSFPVKKKPGERRMPAEERKKYMKEAAQHKAAGTLDFS